MARLLVGSLGAATVYCAGVYAAMQYMNKDEKATDLRTVSSVTEDERMMAFQKRAKSFDADLGRDETFMGITLLRRLISRHATGKVLELGAGTGRNLDYILDYGDPAEITLTDFSENMLSVVKEKIHNLDADGSGPFDELFKQAVFPNKKRLGSAFIHTQACSADDLSCFEPESFDTVIDTFGLCSYERPDRVLAEMRRICRKGGKLLLLEHGKGHFDFLNEQLDKSACDHAVSWGCVWNKDIEKILLDAGFQQKSISRYHLGTTFYVVEEKSA